MLLAWQALGQFGRGDLPFNELGLIGGEGMMRGYYRGRYRDRTWRRRSSSCASSPCPSASPSGSASQAFFATGTVFSSFANLPDARPLFTGGGGLRLLTFPASDIYTRLDVGVSEDGSGVYLYVGEAF